MTAVLSAARLANGVTLPYLDQGDVTGIPIVLVPGFPDTHHSFDLLLPHLPASWRAIAITQRGHGDSVYPSDTSLRMDDFVNDLPLLLDELGIDKAVIAGHSLGSVVAQGVASTYPERVLGVVLLGSFASIPAIEMLRVFFEEDVPNLSDPIDRAFVDDFQKSTTHQPVDPAHIDLMVSESMKMPARIWIEGGRAILERDYQDELGRIAAPTLILWGSADTLSPREEQETLVSSIPQADLIVYENSGHSFHWEDPQRVATDITAFVDRIAG